MAKLLLLISALVVALLLPGVADAVATYCEKDGCVEKFAMPCHKVLTAYRLYGTCCSLQDVGKDLCHMTVAGENVECSYKIPAYDATCSSNPDDARVSQWNILYANTRNNPDGCPTSPFKVPVDFEAMKAAWKT